MFRDGGGDGIHVLQDATSDFRVGEFQAVMLFQRHHELQRVHRIQPDAARPEERLTVAFYRSDAFIYGSF